jgi:acetolactate synthase-1/2/3 large subunit
MCRELQLNKPVILLGNGIRNNPALIEHLCSLNIPILTTWMAADLIPEDHPAFCGRPGIFGQRAANIIQQKATHLYCFGARLDGEQVAYALDRFAPKAEKYVFDVDEAELNKLPGNWYRIGGSLNPFNAGFIESGNSKWLAWCKDLYARFSAEVGPRVTSQEDKFVDPFTFTHLLHEHSLPDDVFAISSSGNAPTVFLQSYKVKNGQRISNVSTIGAMGADIPMALGAALATGRRTTCVTGDGGFQMNAQELETIRRLHLPVIFFVMNNGGYNSIRVSQKMRFEGRVMGCTPQTGLTLPRLEDIACAYGFMYMKLDGKNLQDFHRCFVATPLIVEVMVNPEWQQLPRVMASGTPLRTDDMENMTPYLDPAELREIMEWDG